VALAPTSSEKRDATMTLEELYKDLSLGVLSNLQVGGEGSGFIPFEHQEKVCRAINQGLTALHGKFILQEKEVQVRTYDTITLYQLKKIFADTDPAIVPQKYISDSLAEPFEEDVIRILSVFDEGGCQLVLNDPSGLGKIYTPNPTTLQITEPTQGNTYFVMYQAKHVRLTYEDLTAEIDLPEILHPALEAYVAHKIMSPMNGQEHSVKAAEHYAMFEAVCAEVLEKDLVSTSIPETSTKLEMRGWK
jgi:hypothetical protein